MQHARLATFWTVAGVLGTLAVFPYALAINPALVAQLPLPPAVVAQTAQTGLLLLRGRWAGLRLGQPIGIDSPFACALVYRRALWALSHRTPISAALAGCATGMPAAQLLIRALTEIPTAGCDPQKPQPSPLRR